jgi:hypothetical protein
MGYIFGLNEYCHADCACSNERYFLTFFYGPQFEFWGLLLSLSHHLSILNVVYDEYG